MILSNYLKFMEVISNYGTIDTAKTVNTTIVDTTGANINGFLLGNAGSGNRIAAGKNKAIRYETTIAIGTGDTEVDFDDYSLANDITSMILNATQTHSTVFEDGQFKTQYTLTGSNTTGNAFTIKEVGIIKPMYSLDSGSHLLNSNVLLTRRLLDSPITIEDNGSFMVTFQWNEE
jgi:hypothetical protein